VLFLSLGEGRGGGVVVLVSQKKKGILCGRIPKCRGVRIAYRQLVSNPRSPISASLPFAFWSSFFPSQIYYYLEDDTISIGEPEVENSGLPQGPFLSRCALPDAGGKQYHWSDLNIGKNLEVFGKVLRLYECNNATKTFLTSEGTLGPERDCRPQLLLIGCCIAISPVVPPPGARARPWATQCDPCVLCLSFF